LLIGGLLAFGAIVWSAIKYATAAGNTTQQSDARQGIRDAIVGLLLLVGAAIVLRIINPGLVENIGIIEPSQLAPPEAAATDCAPGLSRNYCTFELSSDPAYDRYSGRKCRTVENGPCGSTGRNTRTICGAQGVSCPANPTSIQ
ncbi:MAG: hypothetical protein HY436_01460, partial [Candidatus Liptonbacteria bacterium]|nr:hypothetical protein [Candidatus Liptonbacteria bacterium]